MSDRQLKPERSRCACRKFEKEATFLHHRIWDDFWNSLTLKNRWFSLFTRNVSKTVVSATALLSPTGCCSNSFRWEQLKRCSDDAPVQNFTVSVTRTLRDSAGRTS